MKFEDRKYRKLRAQTNLMHRLENLRDRSCRADERFEQALNKAKKRKDWEEICKRLDIDPEAHAGDWKA